MAFTRGKDSVVGSANVKANQFIETLVKEENKKNHKTDKFLYRKLMITRYIHTKVNAKAQTMKDVLHKQNYRDKECSINALLQGGAP